ncbi:2'-5' RNA ligase family protein [Acinetobacter pragensis]|uniref:2'-5' RNA ligase n=2 Tax=Acinetobacter pragensis TaxID=1806892 RepID=A0A151Y571_9GAMM|nr:2'-5' RNA ligase family protein [Acinetobacter pragensis]KYQ73183.1 2'-5' RNA ligase [Acinetobacter pragensis]
MPVVPTCAHDYPEWHKGRNAFSLWYLEVHSPALLTYLDQLRAAFSDQLFQPNTRQFHITLFICGFLAESIEHDDDFPKQKLAAQCSQLQALNLPPFKLKTGKLNSFESALFIEIEDPAQNLNCIRQQLYQCSDEIAPLSYCPHITIGLYGHALNSNEIFLRMQQIQQQSFEFEVQQVTFGTYAAQQLQGPLTAYQQFELGGL